MLQVSILRNIEDYWEGKLFKNRITKVQYGTLQKYAGDRLQLLLSQN